MMETHEYANLLPMMQAAEYSALLEDMRAGGYDETLPVVLLDGKILDGRNRYKAAKELGIRPSFTDYRGDDPLAFVIRHNLNRRHLNESQRAAIASRVANISNGSFLGNQYTPKVGSAHVPTPLVSQPQAAAMLNVSERLVREVKAVERQAPDLMPMIESGELAARPAAQIAKMDRPEREAVVKKIQAGMSNASQAIREVKREAVVERLENVEAQEAKAVQGVYDVVVIDPPWAMEKIERDVTPTQVAFEYPTMSIDDIAALNIPTAEDCHVFLWTTQKFLPDALDLINRWGFKYVLTFVWHKNGGFQPFGLPQYNCEFAVYARKGTPKFVDFKDFPTCFNANRGAHSEKPEEFYATLRRVTAGRRLDMFNRRKIDGFDGWGKEAAQ
jgi:N6-adenosine-specific RNA methylase IME4